MDQNPLEFASRAIRRATYHFGDFVMADWPTARQTHAFMKALVPGKLVAEMSTIYGNVRDIDAVGTIVSITCEPIDEPEHDEDQPLPLEDVVVIETLDGRIFTWRNARFLAVPDFLRLTS